MKRFLNRAFVIATTFGGGLSALAAEGDIDITVATGTLDKLKTAIDSYWTAAQPFILGVVGMVVVAALIWAGVRLFKGGTSKISGR